MEAGLVAHDDQLEGNALDGDHPRRSTIYPQPGLELGDRRQPPARIAPHDRNPRELASHLLAELAPEGELCGSAELAGEHDFSRDDVDCLRVVRRQRRAAVGDQ